LNSRNPFVSNRPPYQFRVFGLTLTGPLTPGRSSYFASIYQRSIKDSAIVHAVVLDSALNIAPLNQAVVTPKQFLEFYPRIDFKLNNNHTLMIRASLGGSQLRNSGVGDFSLPSRAFETSGSELVLQATETALLNSKTTNEFRLQYIRTRREQVGDDSMPTISVLDSFIGGGSQLGSALNNARRWELHNITSHLSGLHFLKMGGRVRTVRIEDSSRSNFAGTYVFTGGGAPQLDENNLPVSTAGAQTSTVEISSIERYRRTLLFSSQGMFPSQIRALGGGATQLTIVAGDPAAGVSQIDAGAFIQDDWRLRPDLTLSLGLRYETQTNIGSRLNFAPRIAFAWAPGATSKRQTRTVIRGGAGIFYDRFNEGFSLVTDRFDGVSLKQYVITDAELLDLFPQVPSSEALAARAAQQTVWRISKDLTAPYTIQTSISVERQLPHRLMLTTTYINSRGLHYLRARNINSPLPGAITTGSSGAERPFGDTGNIFEFESSGILKQHQLVINALDRFSPRLTFFATYVLSNAKNDTDGPSSFPASTYDLRREYGRASFDVRHRLIAGALINLRRGISLNSFVIAYSGAPFNITTGSDLNGDTLFTDRPAFATDLSKPGVRITRFGAFDVNPAPGRESIPRNYGEGPGYFSASLRISKAFQLNVPAKSRSGSKADWLDRPYSLNVAVTINNILNHTNAGPPVGNLNSPLFGRSNTIASAGLSLGGGNQAAFNRRIDLQVQLNF
jgi:hypothetical protein